MENKALAAHIQRHLDRSNRLPCRVDEMTPREFEIFNLLAGDRGLLIYLQSELSGNPMRVLDRPQGDFKAD